MKKKQDHKVANIRSFLENKFVWDLLMQGLSRRFLNRNILKKLVFAEIRFDELAKGKKVLFFVIPAPNQVRDKLQSESRCYVID